MRLLAAVLVGLLLPLSALADDDAHHRALAIELVHATRSFDGSSVIDTIWPVQEEQFRLLNPTVSDEILADLKLILVDGIDEAIRTVNALVADIYVEELTVEELTVVLDFYNSEVGQRLLTAGRAVNDRTAPALMDEIVSIMPRLLERLESYAQERGLRVGA